MRLRLAEYGFTWAEVLKMDKEEVDRILILTGELARQRFEEAKTAVAMGLSMMTGTRR